MSRLQTANINDATGELAVLYGAIKRAVGKVPNAFATLGSNSPAILAHVLQTGALLESKGSLSRRELEAINLAVRANTGCDDCVAAHTLMGKAAGYTAEQARALRAGSYPDDVKIDALVKFALSLVKTSGTLPAQDLALVRDAGFNDGQIVEAIAAISAILFTNMLTRTNDTTLDFPKPD